MRAYSLADHAARLRSQTLDFVRGEEGVAMWSMFLREGKTFTMPAQWGALPEEQQIRLLLKAEARRVADGTTFALASQVADAARAVAEDLDVALPFTKDVLPAPAGMIVPEDGLGELATGWTMGAVTWGPPMEGFGPGVHVAWWAQTPDDAPAPLFPEFDLHLPFAPIIDARLWPGDIPSGYRHSRMPLRAVVASWYALSNSAVTLDEQRPDPVTGRTLAAQKAKNRVVRVASATDTIVVQQMITADASASAASLGAEHGEPIGAAPSVAATPNRASYGVFEPDRDHQLKPDIRKVAHLYRTAAEHWHRLEMGVTNIYPGIFGQLEELRAREYGKWPSWCWMPSIRVAGWLAHMYEVPLDQAMWDGSRVAAVGAWISGGRHALLADAEVPPHRPTDRVPTGLNDGFPVPGLGLIVPDGNDARLLLAFLNHNEERTTAELTLVNDEGRHASGFRDLTKYTLFLTDTDMTAAVRTTQSYYDEAAIENGTQPHPNDDALYAQHAELLGFFTSPLAIACTPGSDPVDVGGLTGRKPAAPWPPEPGLLPEMQLWLVNNP